VSREKIDEECTAGGASNDYQSKHESVNDGVADSTQFENLRPLSIVGKVVFPRAKKPGVGALGRDSLPAFF